MEEGSLKKALKGRLYAALKRPLAEDALVGAYRLTASLPKLQHRLIRLTPQPYSYRPDEVRRVDRQGLHFVLRPANHFQWRRYFGLRDEVIDAMLNIMEGATAVVDVGANIGFYSLVLARRLGPSGRVYAFEPHPENLRALEENTRANCVENVVGFPFALGDCETKQLLNDVGNADLGKFSLREEPGAAGFPVSVRTLDHVLAELGVDRVDLVKVDVEGREPEVILGARGTLERSRPRLCIEVNPEWYADRPEKARAAFLGLEDLGYTFSEILPSGLIPVRLAEVLIERRQRNLVGVHPLGAQSLRHGVAEPRGALHRVLSAVVREN